MCFMIVDWNVVGVMYSVMLQATVSSKAKPSRSALEEDRPMTVTGRLCSLFSQPSIYIDGWLYAMRMTSVVCNVPVLSQNDSTYHHSVFTT